jgi:hypothetical protein
MQMKELIAALALVVSAYFGTPDPANADSASFVVYGYDTDTIDLTVAGGEYLLTVEGDQSTNLDFYVYDGNGNLIFMDEDDTDLMYTTFVVPEEGTEYQLLVVNQGDDSNIYRVDLI